MASLKGKRSDCREKGRWTKSGDAAGEKMSPRLGMRWWSTPDNGEIKPTNSRSTQPGFPDSNSRPYHVPRLVISLHICTGINQGCATEGCSCTIQKLTRQGIPHTFIGSFGIRLLEAPRPTTDINAMIDVSEPRKIIDRIRPLLRD